MANGYTVGDLTLMPATSYSAAPQGTVISQNNAVAQMDQLVNQLKSSGVLLTSGGSAGSGSSNSLGAVLTNPVFYLAVAVIGGIAYLLYNMGGEDKGRSYPKRYY